MKKSSLLLLINLSLLLSPLPLLTQKSHAYQSLSSQQNTTYNFSQQSLNIINNQIILSPQLQKQLTPEIAKAKKELEDLSKMFSIKFTEEIGIVYFHQGRENWLLKFTYGGLILNSTDDLILSTNQIFALKKVFEQTRILEIEGTPYPTTQFMRQLGPILHDQ